MIDRERLNAQIDRLANFLLDHMEQKKDAEIKDAVRNAGWYAPVTQSLSEIALYESSKTIEAYSKRLQWLTVALGGLTFVLIISAFWPR
jgi:hypothetical protein